MRRERKKNAWCDMNASVKCDRNGEKSASQATFTVLFVAVLNHRRNNFTRSASSINVNCAPQLNSLSRAVSAHCNANEPIYLYLTLALCPSFSLLLSIFARIAVLFILFQF